MPRSDPFSFGLGKGPYTAARNCFMKRDTGGLALEYARQFYDTYAEYRKFFTVRIITGHEFTGENNWYFDEELAKFLEGMDKAGHLENTIVNLYSDHGDHINFVLWQTESGRAEMTNPFLFVMVPEALDKKIGRNLKANQQKLMTHYQLFRNMIDYWEFNIEERPFMEKAESFFYHKLGVNVDCNDIPNYEDCSCFIDGRKYDINYSD